MLSEVAYLSLEISSFIIYPYVQENVSALQFEFHVLRLSNT